MSAMSIHTLLKVAPKLPPQTSVLLRGDAGIGKSQLGRQIAMIIAKDCKIDNYEIIDRRLSQVSDGDIIGLPSIDGDTTKFNPPDWYMRACKNPCYLILDELNRATPEVMQAAFQIILDRELNGHKLHPLTRVFSGVNTGANYTVNDIDPALLDRFWVVDLTPDVKDWINWARSECNSRDIHVLEIKKLFGGLNCLPVITNFIAEEPKWLDTPKNVEPGTRHPSRRSWERCGDALAMSGVADDPNVDIFYSVCVGFLGVEASIKFTDYAKASNMRVSGEDVVLRFKKSNIKKFVSKMNIDQHNDLIEKVCTYTATLKTLKPTYEENIREFMNMLTSEAKIHMFTKLLSIATNNVEPAKAVNRACSDSVLEVFSVPKGEAGLNVMPNIPDVLNNKSNNSK